MRGTPHQTGAKARPHGIIPAHAGNTPMFLKTARDMRDHPRACGEHDTPLHTPLNVIGSSPRMRGTPAQHRALLDESRIIPAHAGNTSRGSCAWYPRRDHPRACGEHVVERRSRRGFKGSSPRMRGTLRELAVYRHGARIIPAHAGNTWRARIGLPPNGDHPRACGEHHPFPRWGMGRAGSSPRMRGTRKSTTS